MTEPAHSRRRVAVIGGGISGLTAAYRLAVARESGAPIEEFLFEGSERLGGVIRTERAEGFVIEAGPDSFLAEKPEAAALCRELGLANSLVGSNDRNRKTHILHRGRLVAVPDGLMLLVPTRLWPFVTTPLLPLRSKLAIAAEWFAPDSSGSRTADESVSNFVRRHFGDAMFENIAEPLLAAVYGGDSSRLSTRSVLARFWQIDQQHGSLTRAAVKAMRKRRASTGAKIVAAELPLFMTLEEGLERLVGRLAERLDGSRVYCRRKVIHIERAGGDLGYRVCCAGGDSFEADAVILAMPAPECGRILSALDAKLAGMLSAFTYNSAMTMTFAYDAEGARHLPPGFGFLVPKKENRRLLACTFVHNKFPHRAPRGKVLLRCFLGGSRDPDVLALSDHEVVEIVCQELRAILNLAAPPLLHRVFRWPRSMAQYEVGHEDRVRAIVPELAKHSGLALAGNAYSGIGISDCIRTGTSAANRVLEYLRG